MSNTGNQRNNQYTLSPEEHLQLASRLLVTASTYSALTPLPRKEQVYLPSYNITATFNVQKTQPRAQSGCVERLNFILTDILWELTGQSPLHWQMGEEGSNFHSLNPYLSIIQSPGTRYYTLAAVT
jgi:hypothetical protein